jgi:hypothetical protein
VCQAHLPVFSQKIVTLSSKADKISISFPEPISTLGSEENNLHDLDRQLTQQMLSPNTRETPIFLDINKNSRNSLWSQAQHNGAQTSSCTALADDTYLL